MHKSSLLNMKKFIDKYMDVKLPYKIIDIGSQIVDGDISGSYKPLFENPNWTYYGADLVKGKNVDVVLEKPYRWKNIKSKTYDCVVCGQMFEHDEYFWLTMLEIRRILKPDGICCIIAPSGGPEHRYPVDCYRYYPDGLKAVAKYAGLEVCESYAQWNEDIYLDMDREWRDCVLICKRPKENVKEYLQACFRYYMVQWGSKGVNNIRYGDTYSLNTTWQMPTPNLMSTTYFDTGEGFSEKEAMYETVFTHQHYQKHYKLPYGCREVRFDPIEGHKCLVRNLTIMLDDKVLVQGSWKNNGEQISTDTFLFTNTIDPQIFVPIDIDSTCLEVGADIYYLN